MTRLPTILLVDDEPHSLAAMRLALEDEFDCVEAAGGDDALRLMEEHDVQAVFCDQRMPGLSGVECLARMRERWPETVRVIITGYTETADMIGAINEAGIYQFVAKPWHPDQLLMVARNACQLFQLARDHERLSIEMRYLARTAEGKLEKRRAALREGLGFQNVLRGPSSPLNAVVAQARQFASFDLPVLITGEPGTGKAALARAIHYASLRSDRPFLEINCAGMSDDLLELQLFGARRGAVPGLVTTKVGLFQKADRGTLFLNGVDTLSPRMQLALFRVATERAFEPLGAHETVTAGVRLLAGAHRDLRALAAEGRFRTDLFYALSVAELALPPLRARPGDIELLASHLLAEAAAAHGKSVHGFSDEALAFLEGYDWPGNLRELSNEVTRMLVFAQGRVLGPELISRHILQAAPGADGADRMADLDPDAAGTLKDRVELVEMRILRETLTRLRWNKSRAAVELGLSRVGLRAKLDRYGVKPPRGAAAMAGEG